MDVLIKLVTNEKEIESVHRIMISAFSEYDKFDIPSSAINEKLSTVKELIQTGTEQALLGSMNGNIVGSLRFKIQEDSLYFSRLSVILQARGNGIAKKMISWLEEYGQMKKLDKLFCRVRMDSPQNIEFYQSLGFEIAKTETIINKDGNIVDTVLMDKRISIKV